MLSVHFIGSVWDVEGVRQAIVQWVVEEMGSPDDILIVREPCEGLIQTSFNHHAPVIPGADFLRILEETKARRFQIRFKLLWYRHTWILYEIIINYSILLHLETIGDTEQVAARQIMRLALLCLQSDFQG
jgi:hypothetical protein